jgi:hypothetical protein
MKAWVHSEEVFADALHLTRLHHTRGNWGEQCPDALGGLDKAGPPILLESKSRKGGFPVLIQRAMEQACSYKEAEGRIPVVGLHKNGGRGASDWLVCLRLADFAAVVARAYGEG